MSSSRPFNALHETTGFRRGLTVDVSMMADLRLLVSLTLRMSLEGMERRDEQYYLTFFMVGIGEGNEIDYEVE